MPEAMNTPTWSAFAGVVDGELRRRQRVLDEDVDLLDFFFFDEVQWIEALDLPRDPSRVLRRVEVGDGADAAGAGAEGLPVRLGPEADRGNQADAGDDHTPGQLASVATSSWRAPRCTRWLPSRA
jgi:hypothetical protein